jgi:vitamin B12 transporter
MKTTLLRFALLFFAVSLVDFSAQAQNGSTNALLFGTLQDSSGAGVGDVHVIARLEGVATAQLFKTNSSADGAYTLTLPPGRYHVSFDRSPFVPGDFVFDLAPNQQRKLDLNLSLERLSASVIVTAQAEPMLADQTTASVSVITKKEIDERQSVSLLDALLFAPGIAIGRTGAEGASASVFLNGGNSSYTKVLVDGATVNEPGNAVDFSNFTLDNIDKVEVVRGAESALYGTDAVAGVIQVFTHRGTTRTPEFTLFGEGGSFSTGRGGGQISGLLGAFDYSAAASYFQTEGQGPNNRFLNRTLSGNFGYSISDSNQVRLTLRNNDSDAGIPGQTLLLPPNLDQRSVLHFFSSSARWNFTTGPHGHHEISGAESYNHEFNSNALADFFDANDPFCAPRSPAAVPAITCDFPFVGTNQYNRSSLHAQSSYLLPRFGATAGYQYEVENGYVSALNLSHSRRNNQGGFLDFRYLPYPRVSLNFGLRAEANANFGTRVVPRAGTSLALRLGKGFLGDTRLRAFYGQGIKEPRFDQTFGSNACFPGNPSLRPERSKTWSVGLEQKLASDRMIFSADYFSNRFYDIVSFESTAPPPGSSCGFFGTFFNTDLARARGLNLTAVARPLRWLSVTANYTHDDSRVLVSPSAFDPALIAGNRLIRRPPNSGSLTLNAAFRRLNVNLAGYFTGVRTDSDFLFVGLNLTRNPGYSRFDLAASYNLGRGVSIYTRATNLLDKLYQDALGYPALGRDVRVGMSYRFSGRN